MDQDEKTRLWLHYSSIWRAVLTKVLQWPAERVEHYVENLRQLMEREINDPDTDGFFFDPPGSYLFRPILGDGLQEKSMESKSGDTNPWSVFQRLEKAISGGLNHWELNKPNFDWNQARERYQRERREIEERLATER